MKVTVEKAEELFGKDVIRKLTEMNAEPTGRIIYPAFEPQHQGMDEYRTEYVRVEGGEICAYYYQPSGSEDWEFGEMNGIEYGDIEYIEIV